MKPENRTSETSTQCQSSQRCRQKRNRHGTRGEATETQREKRGKLWNQDALQGLTVTRGHKTPPQQQDGLGSEQVPRCQRPFLPLNYQIKLQQREEGLTHPESRFGLHTTEPAKERVPQRTASDLQTSRHLSK